MYFRIEALETSPYQVRSKKRKCDDIIGVPQSVHPNPQSCQDGHGSSVGAFVPREGKNTAGTSECQQKRVPSPPQFGTSKFDDMPKEREHTVQPPSTELLSAVMSEERQRSKPHASPPPSKQRTRYSTGRDAQEGHPKFSSACGKENRRGTVRNVAAGGSEGPPRTQCEVQLKGKPTLNRDERQHDRVSLRGRGSKLERRGHKRQLSLSPAKHNSRAETTGAKRRKLDSVSGSAKSQRSKVPKGVHKKSVPGPVGDRKKGGEVPFVPGPVGDRRKGGEPGSVSDRRKGGEVPVVPGPVSDGRNGGEVPVVPGPVGDRRKGGEPGPVVDRTGGEVPVQISNRANAKDDVCTGKSNVPSMGCTMNDVIDAAYRMRMESEADEQHGLEKKALSTATTSPEPTLEGCTVDFEAILDSAAKSPGSSPAPNVDARSSSLSTPEESQLEDGEILSDSDSDVPSQPTAGPPSACTAVTSRNSQLTSRQRLDKHLNHSQPPDQVKHKTLYRRDTRPDRHRKRRVIERHERDSLPSRSHHRSREPSGPKTWIH